MSNLVTAKLLLLNVCFNRNLLLLPPSRSYFKLAILSLLADDVSLNPGPNRNCNNESLSIKPKTVPFSEYVTSKNLDSVAVTET